MSINSQETDQRGSAGGGDSERSGKDLGIYSKRDGKQLEESDLRKDVIWIIFNHIVLISSLRIRRQM